MSRIYVLGNAMVDLSLPMARLPLPGETVVATGLHRAPGGKGLNQAVVAARAGGTVVFQAMVGRDAEAGFIAESLRAEGFAGLQLLPCDAPSDMSILMVAEDSENSIVSLCAAADTMTVDDAGQFAGRLEPGDWLVIQGNLSFDATRAAVSVARDGGGRVFFNPAPLRWPVAGVIAQSDIVVVNRVEATLLSGQDDPAAAARALRADGAGSVVVTLGADGVLWLDEAEHGAPAPVVAAVDSTGAGDSFCGTLVAMLAGGMGFGPAIVVAQAAAGLAVTRRGAFKALPSRAEMRTIAAA